VIGALSAAEAARVLNGEPFPPFSGPEAECPKCLVAGTKTTHHDPEMVDASPMMGPPHFVHGMGPRSEWLERRCRGCGFMWPERCADAGVAS
jgi:hypothetical protein